MNSAADSQQLDDAIFKTLFNTRRSARYHMRREAFYDTWNKVTSALAVVFGSSAVGALISDIDNKFALYAAAVVAVTSALDLVAGAANKARLHNDLRRRFIALERKLIQAPKEWQEINSLQDEYLSIETDEPPVMRALDTICYNDLLQAMGYKSDEVDYKPVTWLQRKTAHFYNWSMFSPGSPTSKDAEHT